MSLSYFSPNSGQWCLPLANVSNSSKCSNLCSFSDKPRHLVVLAWDAGCTMGCCKLCAWSGPGTPHLMGNSLNSAHLGRQCRLGPLIFCCSSQIASQPLPLPPPTYPAATVPGHSPRAIPADLRPLAHAALVVLIKLSYPASGQAYTNRPSYLLTEHSVYCLLGPNIVPATGSDPEPNHQLAGRQIIVQGELSCSSPTYSGSLLAVILNVGPRTLLSADTSPLLLLFFFSDSARPSPFCNGVLQVITRIQSGTRDRTT